MAKRKWTFETASQRILNSQKGKLPAGLSYWSAVDYIKKHAPQAVPEPMPYLPEDL